MKEIGLEKLKDFKDSEIVDVREREEFIEYNVGGRNIPAHELNHYMAELELEKKLLVLCSNGMRSSIMARVLQKKLPDTPIYHLSKGIIPD